MPSCGRLWKAQHPTTRLNPALKNPVNTQWQTGGFLMIASLLRQAGILNLGRCSKLRIWKMVNPLSSKLLIEAQQDGYTIKATYLTTPSPAFPPLLIIKREL